MGDIKWVVISFGISLLNDTTYFIIAFALVLIIINIILGVFYDNNK